MDNTTNIMNPIPYCIYRLPCGVCMKTNLYCPLNYSNLEWSQVTCNSTAILNSNKENNNG